MMGKSAVVHCFKIITTLGLPRGGAPIKETGHEVWNLQKEEVHSVLDARHPGQVCGGCYKLVNREAMGLVMA